jgi:hypothetical protein
MEAAEFRNAVFAHLSTEGFVQSYKTQLRLAIHKFASANRDFSFPPYQHSLRSEIICNIVADYLKAYSYRDALHVFMEESAYHKIPQSDIMRQIDIPGIDGTILETLMKRKGRPSGNRSTETQTDHLSITDRLALLDDASRIHKFRIRTVERQKMVQDRLQNIRETKAAELEGNLEEAFEARRALETSRAKFESNERFSIEIQRMKAEFDAQYSSQSKELKLAREQEEETIRMLQRELDRQLASLRASEKEDERPDDALNIERLRRRCNGKLNKLLNKGKKLVKLRQDLKAQFEEEKLAYQRTLRVLAELRQRFAAIRI